MTIPHALHVVWVGNAIPEWVQTTADRWRLALPGWSVRIAYARPEDIEAEYGITETSLQADLLKYRTLAETGGVTVDADVYPLAGVAEYLDSCEADCIAQSPSVPGVNCFFCVANADSPAWGSVYCNACANPALVTECGRGLLDCLPLLPVQFCDDQRNSSHEMMRNASDSLQATEGNQRIRHYLLAGGTPTKHGRSWSIGGKPPIVVPQQIKLMGHAFTQMPNGDLLADPGQPEPEAEPDGYMQDVDDPHRFHPIDPVETKPCRSCRGL